MASSQKPFRVIIVGGGLVALTSAHIFSKAGIEFILLEQHKDLLPDIGTVLTLWPPTFRIFDQLGILDTMMSVMDEINLGITMSADDGTIYSELDPNPIVEKNHGHRLQITSRPRFIEALYNTLPEDAKSRIKVNKRVVNVNVFDDEVSVECSDGTIVKGSIVIGADGVHSRTRQCMQALAEGKPPPEKLQGAKSPFITTYRMLFGNIPIPLGLGKGRNHECSTERVSTQVVTGQNQAWFAIYEALDKPTSERVRYTDKDKEAVIQKWGHLYAAPGYRIRDIYSTHVGDVGLIHLEEGRVDKWSWKRIVLVSDAVRKLEPHAGLGYNSGLVDMVVLVNMLRNLLETEPSPTTKELEAVFANYQKDRLGDESAVHTISIRRARQTAWLTPFNKLMCKYIAPWINLAYIGVVYIWGPVVSRVPVLEWLEEKSLAKTLQIPYKYYPLTDESRHSKDHGSYRWPIYTGAVTVAALTAVGLQYYRRI
ncbi:FAD/NAD(P)-binding domain-containing protein [Annulohypoxylon maeteangense]|uniref:FAD/NAD(P)-binding domain-containing protein n=1 Tax=Annulohypoxylon maeteangense TaxID=1927788 RepID=UPI002007C69D|nr:FAD/NAD(P)-binding domain-containing protein [Annulohypoxylon maeteangense]KAI0884044.1 FAD/NAD(P)-binding domain-containing protein [Annulohypoxylon maeteangense]